MFHILVLYLSMCIFMDCEWDGVRIVQLPPCNMLNERMGRPFVIGVVVRPARYCYVYHIYVHKIYYIIQTSSILWNIDHFFSESMSYSSYIWTENHENHDKKNNNEKWRHNALMLFYSEIEAYHFFDFDFMKQKQWHNVQMTCCNFEVYSVCEFLVTVRFLCMNGGRMGRNTHFEIFFFVIKIHRWLFMMPHCNWRRFIPNGDATFHLQFYCRACKKRQSKLTPADYN